MVVVFIRPPIRWNRFECNASPPGRVRQVRIASRWQKVPRGAPCRAEEDVETLFLVMRRSCCSCSRAMSNHLRGSDKALSYPWASSCHVLAQRRGTGCHFSHPCAYQLVGDFLGELLIQRVHTPCANTSNCRPLDAGDWSPAAYGTHSLRRTKASLIYRRTKNLRAVQQLLDANELLDEQHRVRLLPSSCGNVKPAELWRQGGLNVMRRWTPMASLLEFSRHGRRTALLSAENC
jgi:hypothetical protein